MNANIMINKIMSDYNNINLHINGAIKYRFIYNGYQTDVFYTTEDELKNQLLISITIDDEDYISTLYFSKHDGKFTMKAYLPPELYKGVQFTLLYVNGKCSTTPYFDAMEQFIMNMQPIQSNHRIEIAGRNVHKYKESSDNPFFETIIRKHMSKEMVKKINSKYDSDLAKEIFKYCGNNKTLRFTPDFTKSKDIISYIR